MCLCMLIMVHECADIGRSVITKKSANSQMQHCIILHGTLHGTFVDHV